MNTGKTRDNVETYKTVGKSGHTDIRGAVMREKRRMEKVSPLLEKLMDDDNNEALENSNDSFQAFQILLFIKALFTLPYLIWVG
jgi:hypothetical protein